ncbi:hypothetical protein [Aequorivita vladivostokensis]|jgi:hypothetical protein|uniref:hypothetical protein n=1 Tax=Aequorivita vladivostokensis TaxID=171194 RepID=UPI0005D35B6B|nr:hypothetical protein [Aequorivita vladivostokensis]MAB56723.1 hypothetical protein [Aequorivita sp.]MAO47742.1 hypothetical protein [Aequorivita sp.]MBF29879.1 hypothetical protein [Aequorivita sp.]|tara:strand:- start:64995 stop:65402 length:408 start_codon:yes stop_codon:yes gene_type:complete
MKKIVLLLMLTTVVFSCKNSEEKTTETTEIAAETPENIKAYKGDFIDSDGALVLMGTNFIYGVKRNDRANQLSQQVAKVKKNDFDMVGVVVRGTISKNTDSDSEWDEVITITEIMRVNDKPSEADIKFEESAKNN